MNKHSAVALAIANTKVDPYSTLRNALPTSPLIDGKDLEQQCDICGDHHEPDKIPRACETGDGE